MARDQRAYGGDAADDDLSFGAVREGVRLAAGFADVLYAMRLEPDPCFEYVSPSVVDLVGYTPEEHYADPGLGLRLVDPRDRAVLAAAVAAPEGEVVVFTVRWIARGGRRVWTQHRCRTVRRPDGSRAVYGAIRDVSSEHVRESLVAAGLDSLPNASVMIFDTRLRYVLVRGQALSDNDFSAAEFEGRSAAEALGAARWDFYRPLYEAALAGRTSAVDVSSPDGLRRYAVRVSPVLAADGSVAGGVSVASDVTVQTDLLHRAEASEGRYRLLAENSGDFVMQTSPEGVIEWISQSVASVLGWRSDELVGTPAAGLAHPDEADAVDEMLRSPAVAEASGWRGRIRCADGDYRWLQRTLRPLRDDTGTVVGFVSGWHDVHAQVAAEQALARSERQFRSAIESAPIGMAVVDLDRRFRQVNPALCRMLAREAGWLLSHRVSDVLAPGEGAHDLRLRAQALAGHAPARREAELLRGDGGTVWVEHSVGALRDDDGVPQSYVLQFVDVTEARRDRQRLRFLATHDAMTSLVNRAELLDRMTRILRDPARAGRSLGLLFCDIDGLKEVNDTLGHAMGDRVIVEVARRIRRAVRSDDVVARLGGDEFVVLLLGAGSAADAGAVATIVADAIGRPIDGEGGQVQVSSSIGIAMAGPGDEPERVLARADLALYRAKRSNRGGWAAWDPDLDAAGPAGG